MRPLHARLVREAQRRDPKFAPRPFTAKALEPIAHRLGTLPDDYRAFLLEIGRLTGSLVVGHPADFDLTELPDDFVPFAEDAERIYAFGWQVDRRARADELRELAVGKKMAERARLHAEAEQEELAAEGTVAIGVAAWSKADGEVQRSKTTFSEWLESMTAPKPKVAAKPPPKVAAGAAPVDATADVARALDLIDVLVAAEKLEVDASFDENACAKKLAKCLDDVESVVEVLVDARGVVELYATEDDIEAALSRD